MSGRTPSSTPIPTAPTRCHLPERQPLRWRSAEHLWGGQSLNSASYRHEQRTSRQHDPQPYRTLRGLPLDAHDFGDDASNTAHEADDNTNSKLERPWTLTMKTPKLLDDYNS
jgi:hypothetical protein